MAISNSPPPVGTGATKEPPPAETRPPKGLGLTASVALLLMALIAASSLSFAAGRLTAPAAPAASAASPTSPAAGWLPGVMPGRQQGGLNWSGYASVVSGTVKAVDSSTVTIRLPNGRSTRIGLNDSTTYRIAGSPAEAGAADLKVGARVTIGLVRGRTPTAGLVVIQNP
jgi:hypothetical protein